MRDRTVPAAPADHEALTAFLRGADLTLSGLGSPSVHLWNERDADGAVAATTGFELSADGRDALIRSVAVREDRRRAGAGSALARYAIERAAAGGARRAWLFSRRSGPFWRKLGFEVADRHELARRLPDTYQVRLFGETGQLDREVAWRRPLP
ncbi:MULTISPECIES: GNAT family N-acetyltransferase [Nocardiopsis]|uniref:GNAT family N-acetyltransferase n=1 Tax=Nocardiopsis sinuspersici TaxID=501010 RepID=A0A1V3BXI4_9ACTN|nr:MULTISPECIES: GNAT family N-acetyltransferase [Nocardiopsis]OOC53092.1 GNAT family N-acetyltransferase [Nocardiopsis sinuspersici]